MTPDSRTRESLPPRALRVSPGRPWRSFARWRATTAASGSTRARSTYEQVVRGAHGRVRRATGRGPRRRSRRITWRPASVSIFRIYRDTRFSQRQDAVQDQHRRVLPAPPPAEERRRGPLHRSGAPKHVWYGGGVYMPSSRAVAARSAAPRRAPPPLRDAAQGCARSSGRSARSQGETLTRVPRGFPADHPAADWLRHRQFLAGVERPAEFATSAGVLPDGRRRRSRPSRRSWRSSTNRWSPPSGPRQPASVGRAPAVTRAVGAALVCVASRPRRWRRRCGCADEADREAFRGWFTVPGRRPVLPGRRRTSPTAPA